MIYAYRMGTACILYVSAPFYWFMVLLAVSWDNYTLMGLNLGSITTLPLFFWVFAIARFIQPKHHLHTPQGGSYFSLTRGKINRKTAFAIIIIPYLLFPYYLFYQPTFVTHEQLIKFYCAVILLATLLFCIDLIFIVITAIFSGVIEFISELTNIVISGFQQKRMNEKQQEEFNKKLPENSDENISENYYNKPKNTVSNNTYIPFKPTLSASIKTLADIPKTIITGKKPKP